MELSNCLLTKYNIHISNLKNDADNAYTIHDIINDMIHWKNGLKNISYTAIVDPDALANEKNVYLFNIINSINFYIVTLWESELSENNDQNNITSIDITSALDNIQPQSNKLAPNLVPGKPKIFIFPKNNVDTCYSFTWSYHNQTGVSLFKKYFTIFLNEHSSFVEKEMVASEENLTDFSIKIEHDDINSFVKHINFIQEIDITNRQTIEDNITSINTITRISNTNSTSNLDLDAWEKFLMFFNKDLRKKNKTTTKQSKKTTSKVSYTPTKTELLNLFNIFDNKQYGIVDIKFEFKTDSNIKPIYLSKSIIRIDQSIDLNFKDGINIPDFQKIEAALSTTAL